MKKKIFNFDVIMGSILTLMSISVFGLLIYFKPSPFINFLSIFGLAIANILIMGEMHK